MHAITEAQATAEGLSIVRNTLAAPTVVERLTAASLAADALAARVEALLSAGKVRRSDLLALSDGLGSLHVELDDLADERRRADQVRSFEAVAWMIWVHFVSEPGTTNLPVDRFASLPDAPRVGERVVFEPGLPQELEVTGVRWCLKEPGRGSFGMVGYEVSELLVTVRPFEAVA